MNTGNTTMGNTRIFLLIIYLSLSLSAVLIGWNYPFLLDTLTHPATEKALLTIEDIGKKPHSFRDEEERTRVCNYLLAQLQSKNLSPVTLSTDSVRTRLDTYVTANNIFVRITPPHSSDSVNYLLLMAHYDSTGIPSGLDSTRFSYGAADDGYGIGIIMSLLDNMLSYRSEWKQGVCILFTDLEEEHMAGMKGVKKMHPEIFNHIGLAINIEARGVKGPALLFETSPHNSKLLELYSEAGLPYGYSLTSTVYGFMPNYTDFGIIKDEIPGMNIAVIDNLNYYHTHLDNPDNISEESLSHYLIQLSPLTQTYLISEKYKTKNSLRSDSDKIYFLFPPFGLLQFSKELWSFLNFLSIAIFLIFFFRIIYHCKYKWNTIFKYQVGWMIILVLLFFSGTCVIKSLCYFYDVPFALLNTRYLPHDTCITFILIGIFICILTYLWYKNTEKRKADWWLNLVIFTNLLSILCYVTITDNFFLLLPGLFGLINFYLFAVNRIKWLGVILNLCLLLTETSFIRQLYYALTCGITGLLTILSVVILIPVIFYGFYIANTIRRSSLE